MSESEKLQQLVDDILSRLGLKANVEVEYEDGTYTVSIATEDSALLIGRAGETLKALQTIIRLLAYNVLMNEERIVVDVNDYRKQKEEELCRYIKEIASRVKELKYPETLQAMSSYERRLAHQIVGEMGGLSSESSGEGEERRITIRPE